MRIPPYLQPGDTIALVCPAGYMPRERATTCIETLQSWGYRVRIGNTIGGTSDNYFSGTDDERLAELEMGVRVPRCNRETGSRHLFALLHVAELIAVDLS